MDTNEYVDPLDPEEAEVEKRRPALDADAVPPDVGVYDRPERQGMSPTMMALLIVVLLVLVAVALFVLL
jgi:hypothetical protein